MAAADTAATLKIIFVVGSGVSLESQADVKRIIKKK
jgi:hypothetical protein